MQRPTRNFSQLPSIDICKTYTLGRSDLRLSAGIVVCHYANTFLFKVVRESVVIALMIGSHESRVFGETRRMSLGNRCKHELDQRLITWSNRFKRIVLN